MVRVGSDPTCDWPVVAPGIAPEVVRFACQNGVLYFRAAPGVRLRVNGARAWDGVWLPAHDGMRLDVGTTSFDVMLEQELHASANSDPDLPEDEVEISRVSRNPRHVGDTVMEVPIPEAVAELVTPPTASTGRASAPTLRATRGDLDDTLPAQRPRPALHIVPTLRESAPNYSRTQDVRTQELVAVIEEDDGRPAIQPAVVIDPLSEPEPIRNSGHDPTLRPPRPFGPRTERRMAQAPSPFDDHEETTAVLPPMLWPNSRTIRRVFMLAVLCLIAYAGWVYLLDRI